MHASDAVNPAVLVVDDDRRMLTVVAEMVLLAGYPVFRAAGPEEAIQVFVRHEEEIHLLLSDMTMPGMNGEESGAHCRAAKPELAVLFMSGGEVERGPLAKTLQKPFGIGELHIRIAQVLEGRQ